MKVIIVGMIAIFGLQFQICSQEEHSPYAGQEHRQIKALSESQIKQFFNGAGMGFAKAAELNHFPGPKHVLELAESLQLDDQQIQQTRASFDRMHAAAVKLGKQIVHSEKELDDLFKSGTFAADDIAEKVDRIAALKGKLRFTHLNAHLEMKTILSESQIRQYDDLRGYSREDGEMEHHQPHHD